MAYYFNASLYYSAPPVPGKFGSYPLLGQTSAIEEVNGQPDSTFKQWNTAGWPGPMVGSATSLRATVSYGEYCCNPSIDWHLMREFPESVAMTAGHIQSTIRPQLAAMDIPTADIEG